MLNVGVIGCGYWGPNLIRNFVQMNETNVTRVADLDENRLDRMKALYPAVETTTDYNDIVSDKDIDVVAIATPVQRHYEFASEAIQGGKHVFVEKPITSSIEQAENLIALAQTQERKLMVGHTFLYTAAVKKIKEIIDSGDLGDIYYISAQRLNLGLFQQDINVMWDLAPHDISIILYLLGREPVSVTAIGEAHINPAVEDVSLLTMKFTDNQIAFVKSSWLDPDKVRKITVVGSKKMLVYDDVEPTEKIRIYDKGIEKPEYYDSFGDFPYTYKYGDIVIPKLDGAEPIRTELEHFVHCIGNEADPLSDGKNGLQVVTILETAQKSLKNGNNPIRIQA